MHNGFIVVDGRVAATGSIDMATSAKTAGDQLDLSEDTEKSLLNVQIIDIR